MVSLSNHGRTPVRHPPQRIQGLARTKVAQTEKFSEKVMKLAIDKEAGALYLRLDNSRIVESEVVAPGVVLDYNENDEIVGVEMLYLSIRFPGMDLTDFHLKTT